MVRLAIEVYCAALLLTVTSVTLVSRSMADATANLGQRCRQFEYMLSWVKVESLLTGDETGKEVPS